MDAVGQTRSEKNLKPSFCEQGVGEVNLYVPNCVAGVSDTRLTGFFFCSLSFSLKSLYSFLVFRTKIGETEHLFCKTFRSYLVFSQILFAFTSESLLYMFLNYCFTSFCLVVSCKLSSYFFHIRFFVCLKY